MAKKSNVKPPRGTRDFLPDDLHRRRYVVGVIRDVYEAHGFQPLETPSYERLETLLGKYGDEGDQLVFKLLKRGQSMVDGVREAATHIANPENVTTGRSGETAPEAERMLADLGLRYDLTVPLARVYAAYQNDLPAVFRRYQIQPVWRADNPGKGRFREFYQCDLDIVGSESNLVDAEVCGAVAECMNRLGFEDFEIRLNHRKLLSAMIEVAGIDGSLETAAIIAIDKLDKIGEEGVAAELGRKGVSPDAQQRLLDLVIRTEGIDGFRAALKDSERGNAALDEVAAVLALAKRSPAAKSLTFSPTLARGLGYYTGCIFEIAVPDLAGSLGGGGRYDGLVGMFLGRPVPACGFAIGLERILVVMEQRGMFPQVGSQPDVIVAATKNELRPEALSLAYALRAVGLKAELVPGKAKPGKIRKDADAREVAHVAFVESSEGVNLWSRSAPDVRDRIVPATDVAGLIR